MADAPLPTRFFDRYDDENWVSVEHYRAKTRDSYARVNAHDVQLGAAGCRAIAATFSAIADRIEAAQNAPYITEGS